MPPRMTTARRMVRALEALRLIGRPADAPDRKRLVAALYGALAHITAEPPKGSEQLRRARLLALDAARIDADACPSCPTGVVMADDAWRCLVCDHVGREAAVVTAASMEGC